MSHADKITKDLVVLGDCATNGTNTMAHEVFQDPDITATFSIQYHMVTREHAVRWYLKHVRPREPRRSMNVRQLEQEAVARFNREFGMNARFQGDHVLRWYMRETGQTRGDFQDPDQLKAAALKYLRQRERQNSWVNMLDTDRHRVHDYCVNGNHFGNYLVRMRKHVTQHGTPELVLITDYSPDHVFTNIRYQGKRYTALMSDRYLYMDYDDRATCPEAVYEMRRQRYVYEKNQTQHYRDRKSRGYQRLLERYLQGHGIPYVYVLYRHENLQFVKDRQFIDLRHIHDTWYEDKSGRDYLLGQNSRRKCETQADCARIVQEYIRALPHMNRK